VTSPSPTSLDPDLTQPSALGPQPAESGTGVGRWEPTLRRLLISIALYVVPLSFALHPVTDPDIWWHLRTGQWIVNNGTVPATDPFSSYGKGRPWIAYSWLFEMLVYGAYKRFGLFGIVLLRVFLCLMVAATIHRFVTKREPRFLVASALTAVTFIVLCPLLSERPWLFTILFGTLTLDVLLDLRRGVRTRAVWLLPVCFALWANLHIQFVYGLFLLGLACAAPWIDCRAGGRWQIGSPRPFSWRDWWKMAALAAACAAATLINPYHIRLYGVVLEYATQTGAYELIGELRPIEFGSLWSWCVLALTGISTFLLARRRTISSFELILLAAATVLAFRAQRDAWFLALAALAILAQPSQDVVPAGDCFPMTGQRLAVVGAGILALAVFLSWKRDLTEKHLDEEVASHYPAAAAAFVEKQGYVGPLYNHFNWGGYLIWRLPQLPVAMDGRSNLYGDERIRTSVASWAGLPAWESDPELAGAGIVIADVSMPLAELLRFDSRFQQVYKDSVAVVFVGRRNDDGR
jgi:hypothetical protein